MNSLKFRIPFVVTLFVLFYAYAIVRYHVGKDLWQPFDFVFVLNKAIAWLTGTVLLFALLSTDFLKKFNFSKKKIGNVGFTGAIVHVTLNIALLCPRYYPKFYTDGYLNAYAWTVIALGALTFIIYAIPLVNVIFKLRTVRIRWSLIACIFNLLHVTFLGAQNWIKPSTWPFAFPPITLLFFVTGVAFLLDGFRHYLPKRN
jgi:hypothetical protein